MSRPTLALIPTAFKAGKLYSVLPGGGSGDFTVSRNGAGTFIGQDGFIKTALANEPRFEYNSDGSFKGVLVEPAATNLVPNINTFNTIGSGGALPPIITNNYAISPGGLQNASRFQFNLNGSNSSSDRSLINKAFISTVMGSNYTGSVYLKATTPSEVGKTIRFITEQITGSTLIYTLTSEWQRVSVSGSANDLDANFLIEIRGAVTDSDTLDCLIWGNQMELGAVATSYISTTTIQVTRPADVITRDNAQDLIGQTEGTVFIDYVKINLQSGANTILSIAANNSNLNNTIAIFNGIGSSGAGRILIQVRFSQTWIVDGLGQTSISPSGRYKICLTYSSTQIKLFINGILIRTDTHNLVPSEVFSVIDLGSRNNSLNGNGLTKKLLLSKTALTESEAIAITTL